MTNGGTTQERDADERQAEGSKNNDEGGQVRKGAQVGSRASQSVADPLSLSLSHFFSHRFRRSDTDLSFPGQRESSRLLSSSPPGPTGAPYNTCKWKLLKKKNPPSLRGRRRRRRRRETHSFGAAAERRVVNF